MLTLFTFELGVTHSADGKIDQLVATGLCDLFLRHDFFILQVVPSSKRYAI